MPNLKPSAATGKKRHKKEKKEPPNGTGKPADGARTGHAALREATVYIKDPRPASAFTSLYRIIFA